MIAATLNANMQAAASDKRVITISFGTAIQTYVPRLL
jgi:hypothetical protein